MKRRLIPALSLGIVVILIGTLAYAADRRKKSNTLDLATEKMREEEALKAELLNALEIHEQKSYDVGDKEKVDAGTPNGKKGQLASKK
jgi:hypothetical protein